MCLSQRVLLLVGALAFGFIGCTSDPAPEIVDGNGTRPSHKVSEPSCNPGEPLKSHAKGQAFQGDVPSRCPTSKHKGVGYSEEIYLGSVLAKQPCKELPDFAGSWWKPQPPFPKHFRELGHELVRGTMTHVSEDGAEFVGAAVRLEMRNHKMRIPPKGRLVILFSRIDGPAHVGGCD